MSATAVRPRRRTWRQDPAGRRARVLAAAAEEFARRGYRHARVADIAAAAEVAEGSVYHLFGSKRGLLVAVGEDYGAGLARAAFGHLGREPQPEDVEAIVRNIFGYVRRTPGPLAAFLLSGDPQEGALAQDANRATMLRAIESLLVRWGERPGAVRLHPRIAAEIQFGLVESALRDCFLRHAGSDEAAYIEEVSRCLAATLGSPR